ncbi:MAG: DUF1080 domain-containing protein [Burkholderiales bacterium]|nr:DUF1080 domain-containing protein [Opitutaceae bacterium]
MKFPSLFAFALATVALPALSLAQTPISLFNGHDLAGWIQRGGKATYAVENGEIVGTSVADTPNSFLCTEKTYGDFALEVEFKIDPRINSGVQFRSEFFDHPTEFVTPAKTFKIKAGQVHGYQAELDLETKRDRWWTAAIYDEGRRGWLFPGPSGGDDATFTTRGRALSKSEDWNHIRIEAVGDSIKTWLNGEPRADFQDTATARGFIALQVHSLGKNKDKAGAQVRWRKLTLTEIPPKANTLTAAEKAAGWRLLWDGETTTGWRSAKATTFPANGWSIKDGVLNIAASGGREAAGAGDIISVDRFRQFELMVDFKYAAGANSGIKYYVQPALPAVTGTGAQAPRGSSIGLEFQILDDLLHPDAKMGRDGNRTIASLYDLIPASAAKNPNPIGEWNTARVLVTGQHVEHWLNGTKVLEYERGSPEFRDIVARSKYKNIAAFGEWEEGHILLQDHGNDVSFRNIKIRVPATP